MITTGPPGSTVFSEKKWIHWMKKLTFIREQFSDSGKVAFSSFGWSWRLVLGRGPPPDVSSLTLVNHIFLWDKVVNPHLNHQNWRTSNSGPQKSQISCIYNIDPCGRKGIKKENDRKTGRDSGQLLLGRIYTLRRSRPVTIRCPPHHITRLFKVTNMCVYNNVMNSEIFNF